MTTNRILLAGLGNFSHLNTRHNVGFNFLDWVASENNSSWSLDSKVPGWTTSFSVSIMPPKPPKAKKKKSKTAEDGSESEEIITPPPPVIEAPKPVDFEFILLKPKLYMNENGKAVKSIVKKMGLSPNQIISVYDDLDRDLGKFGIKKGGSANGHNGIKSIINELSSQKFDRLRVGISRPIDKDPSVVGRYVLGKFPREELEFLNDEVFPKAWQLVLDELKKNLNKK